MSKKQPLQNAGQIIERFGGIRPMAAKIDTPVTTVQGWKKRDVIPGTRRTQILSAASDNNIDISDLAEAVVSNENKTTPKVKDKKNKPASNTSVAQISKDEAQENKKQNNVSSVPTFNTVPVMDSGEKSEKSDLDTASKTVPKAAIKSVGSQNHDALMSQIQKDNEKTMKSSAWITTGLILTALSAGMLLFWPQINESNKTMEIQKQQLSTLEKELGSVKSEEPASFFDKNIQGNLQDQMDQIQNQARNISNTVEQLSQKTKEISKQKIDDSAQAITERLDKLESKIKEETASLSVPSIDSEHVEEIKAAAILVAFSQFRNALEREESFENDLAVLQQLVGDDNPELNEKLMQLSEHADGGVLTASGLSTELKKMTGEIVVSSLKGENVSIKEKARARLGSIMQVEKDGEVISGTKTQATLSKAQEFVEQGKIEDSIVALEGLEGESAIAAAPFINKAKASLLAEQVQALISSDILSSSANSFPDLPLENLPEGVNGIKKVIEEDLPMPGDKKIIKDEESGLSILPKSSMGFKGLLDKQ